MKDGCFDDAVPWFAMDLLQGMLLRDVVERGQQETSLRRIVHGLAIARQLGAALSRIHECGVVHCDVKPENVFVVDGDRVVVLDFGAARWLDDASVVSCDESMTLGTWSYMAPECRLGASFDQRADVYAFGCVLHELAFGRPYCIRLHQLGGVDRFGWESELFDLIGELTAFDATDRPSSLSEPVSRLAVIEEGLGAHGTECRIDGAAPVTEVECS